MDVPPVNGDGTFPAAQDLVLAGMRRILIEAARRNRDASVT
jgi:hypothetical protein